MTTPPIAALEPCQFSSDDLKQYYGVLWTQAEGVDFKRDMHIRMAIEQYCRTPSDTVEIKREVFYSLKSIIDAAAKQKKRREMDDDMLDEDGEILGCFEAGYEGMIDFARNAKRLLDGALEGK